MSLRQSIITVLTLGGLAVVRLPAAADKAAFGLGNPTPEAELRDLSSDRPDATEAPFTVDAGHVQLEMDLLNHTASDSGGGRTSEWGVVPFNLRLGVRDNFELGLFVAPYIRRTTHAAGEASGTRAGFGDLTLRAKVNFQGNDGGGTALGLITDPKLPTAAQGLGNGALEGSVLLPVSVELGGGWDLGAMTGVDLVRNEAGHRRCGWINSVTTGHDITRSLAGYVEVATETGADAPVTTLDAGLMLKLNADTQLDAGVQLGLSRSADDALVFTGLTRRF